MKIKSAHTLPSFRELCRHFSELSPQPMLAVEGSPAIICYANPAFCDLAGEAASAMVDRPLVELIPESAGNGFLSLIERVYQTGVAEVMAEPENADSAHSSWSYSCWPLLDLDRGSGGLIIQVTDHSEQMAFKKRCAEINQSLMVAGLHQHELTAKAEQINRELQIATTAKTQFLASMSHEIRTPINVIMGFAELLSMPNPSREDRKNFGERIKKQADLLLRLIDDILDLSKVEAGRLQIEKIAVRLPDLIADIRMVMQHLAQEKGLLFSLTTQEPLPGAIVSDAVRLKQILTNIISNAIKFTSEGSVSVSIRADHPQQKLHFIVSDSGPGMTSEQISRIFQPFTQADSSMTRKFGGTGLGLDLARRLAQALGGDVVLVKSEAGVGSVFEITVALECLSYEAAPAPTQNQKSAQEIRLDNVHVLVADDGPDNQVLVTRYLTLAGALVDLANDGEEAVEMGLEGDYDIILMDIQMPNLNGYDATKRLRKLGCKVPVVAITAHAMSNEIEQCRAAGCDAHLSKPVQRLSLLEIIHRLVSGESGPPSQTDGKPTISRV